MSAFLISSAPSLRQTQITGKQASASSIQFEDWTEVSRLGFRGPKAEAFLKAEQLPVPDQPNQALLDDSGIRVLRLSKSEFWLIDEAQQNTQRLYEMETRGLQQQEVYRLYCQHSHGMFMCRGVDCGTMFAKVCGVDLTQGAFAVNQIAQTSVARVNAIVVNISENPEGADRYLVLSDVSSSQHLWDAFGDAAEEF